MQEFRVALRTLSPQASDSGAGTTHAEWILALAGFCLILLQFFMIREVTALLKGTEVVIVFISLAYFSGYSVGYGFARRLSMAKIRQLSLVTWALHLTLPFSFRYLGGFLDEQDARALAFVLLLFLTAFALSAFYSVLLPRFIDLAADQGASLMRYYGAELVGAVGGAVALFLVGKSGWATAVLYQAALAVLIGLLWRRPVVWGAAAALVGAYAFVQPAADARSLSYSYEKIQGLDSPRMLSSANTFYQRVDYLEAKGGQVVLFLNGRMNYGSDTLSAFNEMLSRFPASVVHPKQALIVGSGSMASVKYVSELVEHVTTVELDQAVIEGSRKYLAKVNDLANIRNWTLHINDAKQFLGSTDQTFDLIVMDVPAPTNLQLGLLHTVDFYRLARGRLSEHGIISVSLSGKFGPDHEIPQTVAAALVEVFPAVVIYTDRGSGGSFALGGASFPFTGEALRIAADEAGVEEFRLYERPEIVEIVEGIEPMTADNMRVIVKRSWSRVKSLFAEGD